jgi:acyl-CoA synthetase (AMP-forming)/AMP-acid ligase II
MLTARVTAAAAGTLDALLAARAAASPTALAFADDRRTVTFGDLAEAASAIAGGLARTGVRAGDRVALVLPAGVGFAETFWALQLLGAVPCAFNPVTLRQTLARRIAAVRPRLVITDDLEIARAPVAPGASPLGPDGLAFLQRTSGTSGDPRVAMLTQRNVIAQLRATDEAGHLAADDVCVSWVPPWHDFGLVRFVIAPVYFGMACHIVRPAIRTIPDWLAAISRVGATHTGAPDFAYRLASRLVDPRSVDLSSLRYAANGGEPVRRSTIMQFEERFGIPGTVAPGYGLAEATLGVTAHRAGEPIVVDERGNVSCGLPFPGVDVRVAAAAGAPGEILVRGDIVFAGYLDASADTARARPDGWLHTGDTGYLDDDGRLFVLGRERAMIKRAGAIVAPRELEDAAHEVAGVQLAAAIGTPAPASALGEHVTVVVEAGDPDAALAAEVSSAVRERLGFAPHDVVVVRPRTIPKTTNGKVRYDALKDLLAGSPLTPRSAGAAASRRLPPGA